MGRKSGQKKWGQEVGRQQRDTRDPSYYPTVHPWAKVGTKSADKKWADVVETEKRFRAACMRQITKGDMKRTFAALPARFQRVIDAQGKATKD